MKEIIVEDSDMDIDAENEEEKTKVVINVRDPKYVGFLYQIKKNAGINYQNMVRLGILFLFKEENESPGTYTSSTIPIIGDDLHIEQQYPDVTKVHVTLAGGLYTTAKKWEAEKNISIHTLCKLAIVRVYYMFTGEWYVSRSFQAESTENLSDYLSDDKRNSILKFLGD